MSDLAEKLLERCRCCEYHPVPWVQELLAQAVELLQDTERKPLTHEAIDALPGWFTKRDDWLESVRKAVGE